MWGGWADGLGGYGELSFVCPRKDIFPPVLPLRPRSTLLSLDSGAEAGFIPRRGAADIVVDSCGRSFLPKFA